MFYVVLKFLNFGYSTVTLAAACKKCYRRMFQFEEHTIYVQ